MDKSVTILVDVDDVLNNLCEVWCNILNQQYDCCVRYQDITEWDMQKAFRKLTKEQIFEPLHDSEIWKLCKPKDGAVEYVKRLFDDGYDIYFCTATDYRNVQAKFDNFIHKYFPYIEWSKIIIANHKQMIKADFLVDDGIHNLENGDYAKILFNAPHNRLYNAESNGMYRANNWKDVYRIIKNKTEQPLDN